jgi:hypothetical protein
MSISPPGGDLTGVWLCDDGGLYYIRQGEDGSVTWAGLQDSGFHKGMGFTNVFRGSLSGDGSFVTGEWADVPRGATASSGTIVLGIWDDASGRRLERVPEETTGGFGGSTWLPTGSSLEPQDIVYLAGHVQRYDKPLGQNNPPCRDFTVMWGTIWQPVGPSLPPDPYDYCSFVNSGRGIWNELFGWGGDGDFTFNFPILWATTYPNGTDLGFWDYGWVTEPPSEFSDPPVTHILRLYEKPPPAGGRFHCEAAMYGRENNSGSPDCAAEPRNLLPGWNERSGWSVLVNGRPVEGRLTVVNPNDPEARILRFPLSLWPDGQPVDLKPGIIARVTGVVADDAGHEGKVSPEIHPVYAIDVLQEFTQERAQPTTLSGVWHGSDNGTYYVRQLDREVWWLGLSRDQGRSFANVFHGSIGSTPVAESGPIQGEWLDVPMGADGTLSGGTLVLQGDRADTQLSTTLTKTQQSAPFGSEIWTKIYDTEGVPVSPFGNAGLLIRGMT